MKIECAACHKPFFRPENDSCFSTCPKCRRPDKSQQRRKTPGLKTTPRIVGKSVMARSAKTDDVWPWPA
jgi:hypothetical protein